MSSVGEWDATGVSEMHVVSMDRSPKPQSDCEKRVAPPSGCVYVGVTLNCGRGDSQPMCRVDAARRRSFGQISAEMPPKSVELAEKVLVEHGVLPVNHLLMKSPIGRVSVKTFGRECAVVNYVRFTGE